jgi:hypothetical protein
MKIKRPACTHPTHLDPAVIPTLADFEWTCPRCHEKTAIMIIPLAPPVSVPIDMTP